MYGFYLTTTTDSPSDTVGIYRPKNSLLTSGKCCGRRTIILIDVKGTFPPNGGNNESTISFTARSWKPRCCATIWDLDILASFQEADKLYLLSSTVIG